MSLYKVPENTNIEATAQRTDILHFMDVSPKDTIAGSKVYQQLGAGFTSKTPESRKAQINELKQIYALPKSLSEQQKIAEAKRLMGQYR